jgi:hypothetical protein
MIMASGAGPRVVQTDTFARARREPGLDERACAPLTEIGTGTVLFRFCTILYRYHLRPESWAENAIGEKNRFP